MQIDAYLEEWNPDVHGRAMYGRVSELYPICRSITGDGVRETLRRIQADVPVRLHEVPTGTPAFDWTVPKEWNVREAWIKNARGEKVVDVARHNLHLLNYSVPFHGTLRRDDLRPHLHALPDHPDWIPYRTSYYREDWGFCLTQRQLDAMTDERYEVLVDTTLGEGHLTYGECVLPGAEPDEVLVSCHVCHPSLANDNLSGIALATEMASVLTRVERRWTYRFVFVPGTIGAIVWLARNEERLARIRAGIVVACVGDPGGFNLKRSRRGTTEIDRAAEHVLHHIGREAVVEAFSPYGYDERQYCSPGFDLPVVSVRRTPHGRYPQYHTSADDLSFVRADSLAESLACYLEIVRVLEGNRTYVNLNPKCEPQLGRRGLYSLLGGRTDAARGEMAMLWVLNLSDGGNSLLDIAERSGMPFREIAAAVRDLRAAGLLEERKGS